MTEPLDLDAISVRARAYDDAERDFAASRRRGETEPSWYVAVGPIASQSAADVPALLAEVERLTAENATLRSPRLLAPFQPGEPAAELLVAAEALRDEVMRAAAERDRYRDLGIAACEMREYLRAGIGLAIASGSVDRFVVAVDAYTAARPAQRAASGLTEAAEGEETHEGPTDAPRGAEAVSVGVEGRQFEWRETEDGPVLVPPVGEYRIVCGFHGILSQRYGTDDNGYNAALRKAQGHRQRCVGAVDVEFVPGEATDA